MRVAVFIDWMNAYRQARAAFGLEAAANPRGQFNPLALARILAGANKRRETAELLRVEIHRGLPHPNHDRLGHAAATLHRQAWEALDPIVVPRLRPVRYAVGLPPVEKGVDVNLAVSAIEWSLLDKLDVAIIFSHDSDLKPVVETLKRLKGAAAVETASWWADDYRRRMPPVPGVVNHTVKERVFALVEDSTNYGQRARRALRARA